MIQNLDQGAKKLKNIFKTRIWSKHTNFLVLADLNQNDFDAKWFEQQSFV